MTKRIPTGAAVFAALPKAKYPADAVPVLHEIVTVIHHWFNPHLQAVALELLDAAFLAIKLENWQQIELIQEGLIELVDRDLAERAADHLLLRYGWPPFLFRSECPERSPAWSFTTTVALPGDTEREWTVRQLNFSITLHPLSLLHVLEPLETSGLVPEKYWVATTPTVAVELPLASFGQWFLALLHDQRLRQFSSLDTPAPTSEWAKLPL